MSPEGLQIRAAQAARLRKLFARQLSTPHHNHQATLEEYTEWEKAETEGSIGNTSTPTFQLPPTLLAAYKKGAAAFSERQGWEEKVDPGRIDNVEKLLNIFLVWIREVCGGVVEGVEGVGGKG